MVYQQKNLLRPSLMQRIFGQQPSENAIIEVNNILATQSTAMITKEQTAEIGNRYGIILMEEFRLNMEEFYAVMLNDLIQDLKLEPGDRKKLEHLQQILALEDNQVSFLTREIGAKVYEKCYVKAIADGRFSDEESTQLDRLEEQLQLPKKTITEISNRIRTNFVTQYFTKLIQTKRISPRDEEQWKILCQNLNITPNADARTTQLFNYGKLYWALENTPLPLLTPLISLQKSESCHLHIENVAWYEERAMRSKYGGTYPKLISSGPIYLTQKRLLHYGSEKAHNIKLEDIIRIQETSDGIMIHKLTGKNPTLKMPQHEKEIFKIILTKLSALNY